MLILEALLIMIPKVRSATGLSQPPVLLHARVRNCTPPRCSCLMSIRVKGYRNVEAAPGVHVRPRLVMHANDPPPLPVALVGRATAPFILACACAMKNAKGRQIIAAPVVIAVAIIALLVWWLVA